MQWLLQLLSSLLDSLSIGALQSFLYLLNSSLGLVYLASLCLVAHFLNELLSLIYHGVSIVANLNAFLLGLILSCVSLSFLNHTVNIILAHAAVRLNGNVLRLAGTQILGRYMYDTIGVNIKGNFNLRNSTRSRWDIGQAETAQGLVAGSHFALALQNMNLNSRLVISCRGEYLALGGRNGGVTLNNLGANTAQSLNTQRQWSYIQQNYVLGVSLITGENTTLDSSTNRYTLIRVNTTMRLLAQILANSFLNSRNTGRTTNHENLGNIAAGDACIFHSLTGRNHSTLNQISSQLIKLCTSQGQIQMLRAAGISSNKWQVNIGGNHVGQLNLSLLSSLDNTLSTHLVRRQINAVLLLELLYNPVHNCLVEVIAAQMGITIGSTNLKYAILNIHNGHIEGTTAQVKYQNGLSLVLVNTISQSSSSRLVDNTQYIQAGNLTSILGCLTLAIIKVSRNSNNCLVYLFTQISLSISLQLLQNHGRNLRWSVALTINSYGVVLLTHMTLDRRNGAVRVGYSLTLCQLAYQTLTSLGEANN